MNFNLKNSLQLTIALIGVIALAATAISPRFWREQEMKETTPDCGSALKMVGIALHQYHDANGAFPPISTRNKDGEQLSSWRVLVSSYMDSAIHIEEFHSCLPWDHKDNLYFLQRPPLAFRCELGQSEDSVVLLAVTGSESCWEKQYSLAELNGIAAGLVQVVAIPDSDIKWTEPRDISILALERRVSGPINVLFVDGSVRTLSPIELSVAIAAQKKLLQQLANRHQR